MPFGWLANWFGGAEETPTPAATVGPVNQLTGLTATNHTLGQMFQETYGDAIRQQLERDALRAQMQMQLELQRRANVDYQERFYIPPDQLYRNDWQGYTYGTATGRLTTGQAQQATYRRGFTTTYVGAEMYEGYDEAIALSWDDQPPRKKCKLNLPDWW